LLIAGPASADELSAKMCAKGLSPAAMQIYAAAAPDMRPSTDMAMLLTVKVTPMVMEGDMNRTTARIAATAAARCLHDLQQPGDEITASAKPISVASAGRPNH
jgi:hypothetical protein